MKKLKEIVKELDDFESTGRFTREQCATLYVDIQVIQHKIEREKIALSEGDLHKLKESKQRLFALLHSLSDKKQNHAKRDARALRFFYICCGLLFLFLCFAAFSKGVLGNQLTHHGLTPTWFIVVWGLMSLMVYSISYLILGRSFDSFLRTMALLWLPLGVLASYDKLMSHEWLWCAIYSLAVLCLIMLSRYPQNSSVLWRLLAGAGLVSCALVCSKTIGLNDNNSILLFSIVISLTPVFILMLLINIEFRVFLYSALYLGFGGYMLYVGDIGFAKSGSSFLITQDENPIEYWGSFVLYFIYLLFLTYQSYINFVGRASIKEEPLGVINKSRK